MGIYLFTKLRFKYEWVLIFSKITRKWGKIRQVKITLKTEQKELITKGIQRAGDLTNKNYFILKDIKLEKLDDKERSHLPSFDNNYLFPDISKWAAMAIKDSKNLFLTGPPGTGKSSLILQIY